jgi:tetrahydromethanopterin S-methyltransferase subunit B
MSFLPSLPGPHDVPFAAPLMTAALLGFVIGFVFLKLLDQFIPEQDDQKK